MTRRLPHAEDTLAQQLVVAGLVLLAIVAVIGAAAGPRAGLAAGVILVIVPSSAIGLLVVLALTLDAASALRRRRHAARLAAIRATPRTDPAQLEADFATARARIPSSDSEDRPCG